MIFKISVKGLNSLTSLINVFLIEEKSTFLYLKVQRETI